MDLANLLLSMILCLLASDFAEGQRKRCSQRQFACGDGTRCIPAKRFCDGTPQCRDRSDEARARRGGRGIRCRRNGRVCLLPFKFKPRKNIFCSENIICEKGKFKCADKSKCIPQEKFCDGNKNCPDGSDEISPDSVSKTTKGLRCRRKDRICLLHGSQESKRDSLCEKDIHCRPDEFACADNSECIPSHWFCDGMSDCKDASDEVRLPSILPGIQCHRHRYSCLIPESYSTQTFCRRDVTCGHDEFPCADGTRCIPWSRFCSGYAECRDGSDEMGIYSNSPGVVCRRGNNLCILPEEYSSKYEVFCRRDGECRSTEFTCMDGTQCVPWRRFCDGLPGCRDESDEISINSSVAGIPCRRGNYICILPKDHESRKYEICDEDSACRDDEFACADGTQCINLSQFCDGYLDCKDHSDEIRPSKTPFGIHCRRGKDFCLLPETYSSDVKRLCDADEECEEDDFMCEDRSQCIPQDWFCDGVAHCRDGSDEIHTAEILKSALSKGLPCHRHDEICLLPTNQAEMLSHLCENGANKGITCADDQFMCRDGTECVRGSWFCDGESYCTDGSDSIRSELDPSMTGIPCRSKEFICLLPEDQEFKKNLLCTKDDECDEDEYACLNGSQCIKKDLFCNGAPDCYDGSDEISPLEDIPGVTCLGTRSSWIYDNDSNEKGGNICILPENQAKKKRIICGK